MTKTILLIMIVAFTACNNEAGDKADESATVSSADLQKQREDSIAAATANAEKERGLELIAKSDCLTCHKVDEKLVGPPYREVANKYPADDATKSDLAQKIIKGGAGVWGNIPMTPHPNIPVEDAKAMAGYILSLKQK